MFKNTNVSSFVSTISYENTLDGIVTANCPCVAGVSECVAFLLSQSQSNFFYLAPLQGWLKISCLSSWVYMDVCSHARVIVVLPALSFSPHVSSCWQKSLLQKSSLNAVYLQLYMLLIRWCDVCVPQTHGCVHYLLLVEYCLFVTSLYCYLIDSYCIGCSHAPEGLGFASTISPYTKHIQMSMNNIQHWHPLLLTWVSPIRLWKVGFWIWTLSDNGMVVPVASCWFSKSFLPHLFQFLLVF